MPSALVIPGVQVKSEFEPAPVLPGATGILGVVGIADQGPVDPTMVGNFGEFIDTFGPASRYTMPEVRTAFANGVLQVVVARLEPGRGQKATLDLLDDDGDKVVTLEARAEGAWGNKLAVRVTQVKTLGGTGVKYVNLQVLLDGNEIEPINNLILDEFSPDYFFDKINRQSRVLVAFDPLFAKGLPAVLAKTTLADAGARAAFALLKVGAADVVRVEAKKPGHGGNQSAIQIKEGQAGLLLLGAGAAPSLDMLARQAGPAGTGIRVSISPAGPDSVNLVIAPPAAPPRAAGPFKTVDDLVAGLKGDPDVTVVKQGTLIPAQMATTPLSRRITINVITEGQETATYVNLPDLAAIQAIGDPLVTLTPVPGATQLPDASDGVYLKGGRDTGPALFLSGDVLDQPLLELVPAPNVTNALAVSVTRGVSTLDQATAVVTISVFVDDVLTETFANLTMDPDDPNYLPTGLESSQYLRAHDLFVRSRATSFPRHMARAAFLANGASPLTDDYQAALDRLEGAEEVDLVLASAANQLDDAGIRKVQQNIVAHCTKMADVARNRIGIGSVTDKENKIVNTILDHANDVRSDYFILTAPAGSAAALAGLLGRQDYFQSPTFKTIASPDTSLVPYSDAQLTQLINGNVLVIARRAKLGIIVIKGLLTSGRQVNVQRTVNKAVREVKAISNVYIGLLNNEGARNSLRQQVIAMFLQMEKDGAIVPSVDGKDPSFKVDVYSTQADFDLGIVRIDIAMRPVRSIDYIYATILVQN